MARLKTTKNELKAQRDTLRRLERYLPTLQLKKTQLQVEVRLVDARIERSQQREVALLDGLRAKDKPKVYTERVDLVSFDDMEKRPGGFAPEPGDRPHPRGGSPVRSAPPAKAP